MADPSGPEKRVTKKTSELRGKIFFKLCPKAKPRSGLQNVFKMGQRAELRWEFVRTRTGSSRLEGQMG